MAEKTKKGMFEHSLYYRDTHYVFVRENQPTVCPFRNKVCGTLCALFEVVEIGKEKIRVVLHCADGNKEYAYDIKGISYRYKDDIALKNQKKPTLRKTTKGTSGRKKTTKSIKRINKDKEIKK